VTKIIEIVVLPTGQTKIETKGFAGTACRDGSRFLEEALGTRTKEQVTGEFYGQEIERHVEREEN
jgi:DUF2997 family protein